MLDHHQRMLAGQAFEQFGGELGFGVGHARHRLIEQQQLRVLHQQHADLQKLLLAVRQQACRALHRTGQAYGLQDFVDTVLLFATQACNQASQYRFVGLLCQLQVLEHTQGFEHRGLLELAPDAGLGDLHFAHAGEVQGVAKPGLARGGAGLAGDHIHQRGFTGAVGADNATQLADADVQVQGVEGLETIEADADVLQRQDRAVADIQAFCAQLAKADSVATAARVEDRFEHEFRMGRWQG
ncbi:hypothetical protein D3C81_1223580 [compost metagenome]